MIKLKDLVLENNINEFSPMGKIHTALEVYLDGVERPFVGDYISDGNRNMVADRILKVITNIAEKYQGKVTGKYSPAAIEWERALEQSEFDKIYNELQSSVENVFNTNLFEFYTSGFLYKATGILGTPISKGKITKWFTIRSRPITTAPSYVWKNNSRPMNSPISPIPSIPNKSSAFGEGDKYQDEYRKFLRNLSSERSRFDNEKINYKIGQIMSTYFAQNPQAIVKKTDWLEDVKPKILKLYK